jgi:hypothetical protein
MALEHSLPLIGVTAASIKRGVTSVPLFHHVSFICCVIPLFRCSFYEYVLPTYSSHLAEVVDAEKGASAVFVDRYDRLMIIACNKVYRNGCIKPMDNSMTGHNESSAGALGLSSDRRRRLHNRNRPETLLA